MEGNIEQKARYKGYRVGPSTRTFPVLVSVSTAKVRGSVKQKAAAKLGAGSILKSNPDPVLKSIRILIKARDLHI